MLSFNITKLDIFQSYFFGEIDFCSDKYKINIQNERRGKVLKLSFEIKPKSGKIVVRRHVMKTCLLRITSHTKGNQSDLK